MEDAPIIKKGSGISPIWILPILALTISGWLFYTSIRDAGITIIIHFQDAEGITAGKTQVMYKGVPVGLVEKILVDEDLQGVSLSVNMEKKAHRGIVKDAQFWIVRPEISVGRVSGLETILSGSYVAFQPGSSQEFAKEFIGLPEAPSLPADSPGLHITLMSEALFSLQKGSPVYTKNLKIGRVLRYYMAEDRSVLIDVYIEPEFSHLIQIGTRFWNSSGISVEGNLQSGLSVKFQSLAALVYGGISCATPEPIVDTSPPATNGLVYKLYSDYAAAEYGITMDLELASGEGIVEGKTKVMYRGLEAGVVQRVMVEVNQEGTKLTVTAEILLDPRAEPILKKNTRFWVIRPEISLDGVNSIDALLGGTYITFIPGDGVYRDQFVVEKEPMPRQVIRDGTHYVLESPDNSHLEAGSPVLFKGMTVGEVYGISFDQDKKTVLTEIIIFNEYRQLVQENSVFWNTSSIHFDASLSHIKLELGTVKSILKGGITFTNPQGHTSEVVAKEGESFTLYSSLAEAVTKVDGLYPRGKIIRLISTSDTYVKRGSPVLYKKVPVGEILGYSMSEDMEKLHLDVLIFEKFAHLLNTSSLFYNSSGMKIDAGLSGVKIEAQDLSAILAGGISFFTPDKAVQGVEAGHVFHLYDNYAAALNRDNVLITFHLQQADGVTENTEIRYQGIQIGKIKKIGFGPKLQEIVVTATVQQEAATLFRESSRVWLVKPSIDLQGVKNIGTVLTGPYISVIQGEGNLRTEFAVNVVEPHMDTYMGLNIILEAPQLGFLDIGNPVYYRQIQVGQVTGYDLSPTAQQVLVEVNIYPEYEQLVYRNSKFWVSSGIRASWDLFSGLKLDTESIEALLSGGISFATPEEDKKGDPAQSDDHFTLHSKKDNEWTSWAPELNVVTNQRQIEDAPPSK